MNQKEQQIYGINNSINGITISILLLCFVIEFFGNYRYWKVLFMIFAVALAVISMMSF